MPFAVFSKDAQQGGIVARSGVDPATILAAGRVLVGVAGIAWPVAALRCTGLDAGTAARAGWLARMFGARDAALGAGALASSAPGRAAWLAAGAACDTVDAVAVLAAVRQGRLAAAQGRVVVAVGAVAAVAGTAAAVADLRCGTRQGRLSRWAPWRRRG